MLLPVLSLENKTNQWKYRIWEKLNLSPGAESSTDTKKIQKVERRAGTLLWSSIAPIIIKFQALVAPSSTSSTMTTGEKTFAKNCKGGDQRQTDIATCPTNGNLTVCPTSCSFFWGNMGSWRILKFPHKISVLRGGMSCPIMFCRRLRHMRSKQYVAYIYPREQKHPQLRLTDKRQDTWMGMSPLYTLLYSYYSKLAIWKLLPAEVSVC